VTSRLQWGTSPRSSIEAERRRRGRPGVVAGCCELVRGGRADDGLLIALAGPAATPLLGGASREDVYWLRVWGMRGLLHAWDADATDAVRTALADAHWRVHEIALKVTARHGVDDVLDDVLRLRADPVPCVRSAIERAVVALTTARP